MNVVARLLLYLAAYPLISSAGHAQVTYQAQRECRSPNIVSPDVLAVAISAKKGATLTDIRLRGDTGATASLVQLEVEDGARPLALVLQGPNVIFELTGRVERVQHVVALHRTGVVGIAREHVTTQPFGCGARIPIDADGHVDRAAAARVIRSLLGREPVDVLHHERFTRISIPSLTPAASNWRGREYQLLKVRGDPNVMHKTPDGGWRVGRTRVPTGIGAGTSLRQDAKGEWWFAIEQRLPRDLSAVFEHEWPGGYKSLPPHEVIADGRLSATAVPPAEAGLLYLEKIGAIRRPQPGELEAWRERVSSPFRSHLTPDFTVDWTPDFVVTAPIEMP